MICLFVCFFNFKTFLESPNVFLILTETSPDCQSFFVQRNTMHLHKEPVMSTHMAYDKMHDLVWGTEQWLFIPS